MSGIGIIFALPDCPECNEPMVQRSGVLIFDCAGHATLSYLPSTLWHNKHNDRCQGALWVYPADTPAHPPGMQELLTTVKRVTEDE